MRIFIAILVIACNLQAQLIRPVLLKKKPAASAAVIIDWPSGTILMWTADTTTIPSGWTICDGRSSTPDLRQKFVRGVNTGEEAGITGGDTLFTPAFADSADFPASVPTFAGTAEDSVVNHVHVMNWNTSATGALAGVTIDASATQNTVSMAYSTANPTGGSATWTPAGTVSWPSSTQLGITGTQATVQPRLRTVVFIRKN